MKFDPLFKVNQNMLFSLDEKSVDVNLINILNVQDEKFINQQIPIEQKSDSINLFRMFIPQNLIESEPEVYNEDFLAKLRDTLKSLESKNQFAVLNIIPGHDDNSKEKICNNDVLFELCEQYVLAIKHCTRRVKDCTSLLGIEFNQEFILNFSNEKIKMIIDELYKKHSHYIYFLQNQDSAKIQNLDLEYSKMICFV